LDWELVGKLHRHDLTGDQKRANLDWFLPEHHRLDSLRELQAVAPQIPVLLLAGWDDDETAMAALCAGAQDVLVKGQLTTSVLERTIRYAVERKQTESVLWQTVEIYRSLVESLPLNVFRKDLAGRFVEGNQRFCDTIGKPLRRGHRLVALVHVAGDAEQDLGCARAHGCGSAVPQKGRVAENRTTHPSVIWSPTAAD